MCNTCNGCYNRCGGSATLNATGGNSCYVGQQRVCRDACGNLRVYTCNCCNSCGCVQNGNGGNEVNTGNNGNGYTCWTICGTAFPVNQSGIGTAAAGTVYPRTCGCRRCGGFYTN